MCVKGLNNAACRAINDGLQSLQSTPVTHESTPLEPESYRSRYRILRMTRKSISDWYYSQGRCGMGRRGRVGLILPLLLDGAPSLRMIDYMDSKSSIISMLFSLKIANVLVFYDPIPQESIQRSVVDTTPWRFRMACSTEQLLNLF